MNPPVTSTVHEARRLWNCSTDFNRRRGITILMVTHEADMAAYAGRRIQFHDGRIDTESGAKSHIREEK